MMSKYYTPRIEEFHKGFRYEKRSSNGDWEEYVYGITPGASRNISSDLSRDRQILEGNYRVKYLDQENIEELGFTYKDSIKLEGSNVSNAYRFKGKDMRGQRVELKHEPLQSWVLIYAITNTGAQTIFAGYIKNYNGLKRLMSQLNITQ